MSCKFQVVLEVLRSHDRSGEKRQLTAVLNAVLFASRYERSQRVKCLKLNEFLGKNFKINA